ncbi:phage minor head protein [Prevotella sp. oral taxon 376]|uniref:phage minor head protein n=1 Tax=Prevotella sp. oral taxon 376 TaxID=712466 RepID=UPI001E449ACA|nr:phage minor head protein [Prevotella sp. oral taxon 376]
MMSALFRQKGATLNIDILASDEAQDFIETHASVLDTSFRQVKISEGMRRRLERSDYIFSGIKTFHELNEAFPSLLDENGNRKPFERFLNDVRKIDETYNINYLRAEYNFVQASAEMAAKWEGFAEDGDRYNLQYRTAGDDKVRPEHAALNGVTLPMSDPFWESYYPPNGWGCRCTVVQVRKSKYPVTPQDEATARGEEALQSDTKGLFRFNAGKQQKTVPDYNPYTIRRCNDCDLAKGKSTLALGEGRGEVLAFIPENELCAACKLVRKCESQRFQTKKQYPNEGKVQVHQLVNPADSDYEKLMQVADFFARQGKQVRLTPRMSRPQKFVYQNIYHSLMGTKYEGKCPDLLIDGKWYEHEGFATDNPKRAFRNMVTHGLKQSNRIIIDRPDLTDGYMIRSIYGHIRQGKDIKEVWVAEGEKLRLLYKKDRQ